MRNVNSGATKTKKPNMRRENTLPRGFNLNPSKGKASNTKWGAKQSPARVNPSRLVPHLGEKKQGNKNHESKN
jgi:hypothetical protein